MQTLPETRENISVRAVLRLAWPVMVARISYTGMTFSDTLFVGQLGTTALAAVGIAGVTSFLAIVLGHGLLGGVRILASHRTGAGDHSGAARLAWQGLWMALGLWPVGLVMCLAGPTLLSWVGASGEALSLADDYLRVRLVGAPLEFASLAMASWFQGRGDTRTPMKGVLLGNLLNVLLDPLFIFGWGPLPGMELGGAALATSLASGAGFLYMFIKARPALTTAEGPALSEQRALLRLGAPLSVQQSLDVIGFMVFVAALARVGEAAMAAHVIAVRVVSLSFLPGFALGEAAGVMVGQELGAGRPDQARRAWKIAMGLAVAVMAAWALLFTAAPGAFVSIFDPSEAVTRIAVSLLAVAAVFQILDAVVMVALNALQGAGDTRFCMAVTVSCAWLVKLPLGVGLALPMGLGAVGAWWGITGELVVLTALVMWRLRGDAWTRSLSSEDRGAASASSAA